MLLTGIDMMCYKLYSCNLVCIIYETANMQLMQFISCVLIWRWLHHALCTGLVVPYKLPQQVVTSLTSTRITICCLEEAITHNVRMTFFLSAYICQCVSACENVNNCSRE